MNTPFLQSHDSYVRYCDSIEVVQADEEALIDQIVASMDTVNRALCDKHRHAMRDAHAKCHGVLVGTLTVYDNLPPHLRQGLFRQPACYPVVLRFSSAPGDIYRDRVRAPKGMALKVLGVPGRKMLAGQEDALTQDFLLVNQPALPAGTLAAYWKAQQVRARHLHISDNALYALSMLASGAAHVLKLAGLRSSRLAQFAVANHHILGETFHSMAPLRFGQFVAKISAAPLSPSVRALTGRPYDPQHAPSILRDQIVDFFRTEGAEYELRAQLCKDLCVMPVEDAAVPWPAHISPHQPVARISFAPQAAYSPARRVYADDILSFTPWHCIPEHRPLGAIMRARLKAYEAASALRHSLNACPRSEPRDIGEVPD